MEEHMSNWDELIKRRAISDLYSIVSKCNDEISGIVQKYALMIQKLLNLEDGSTIYSPEELMQMESSLFRSRQYFQHDDRAETFEEYIGSNNNPEINDVKFDKGTALSLDLIEHYAETLKMKVIENASNNMLDVFKKSSDE